MNAYIYKADLYCEDCARRVQIQLDCAWIEDDRDSDSYPQGPYPNGGGEADTPQHCANCELFLENPLTEDGEQYVKKAIAKGKNEITSQWDNYYRITPEHYL